MKSIRLFPAVAMAVLLATSLAAQAYDADWKRGRIYYRSVCTACHITQPVGGINPSTRLKVEWSVYLSADRHAKGKETVNQYFGKTYRTSVKATNKAAEKFIDVADAELAADVKAFLLKGAKDGDAPATCN
jgi:cytochrome c5